MSCANFGRCLYEDVTVHGVRAKVPSYARGKLHRNASINDLKENELWEVRN